ncbi:MAG: tetratricopeptide repeat protein [Treponema sp.]|nr:tetratricopeptide repeat protein [Treponema sp.]
MKKAFVLGITLFFTIVTFLGAETQGDKLFKQNKPREAIAQLEKEIASGKASADGYNYLGLAYFQTGDFKNSVAAFAKGLKVSGTNKKILSFNQGNSYYAMGDYISAANAYSLTISADPFYTQALLNRANSYLMAKKYDECIEDYEKYLVLEPNDPQRPQIEEILALLRKQKKRLAEEAERKAQEEAKRAEEERKFQEELARQEREERERLERERQEQLKREEEKRLEEERRLAEEAERRRQLMEDVANSLNSDSENMSSGSGDIIDYEQESELE